MIKKKRTQTRKRYPLFPFFFITASALLILFVFFFTFFSERIYENGHVNELVNGQTNNDAQESVLSEYLWAARSGFLHLETGNAGVINGLSMHDEIIYYIYVEYLEDLSDHEQVLSSESLELIFPVIQIVGIDQTGSIVHRITATTDLSHINVIGFNMSYAAEFSVITQEFDEENRHGTLFYTRYDHSGNLLVREKLLSSKISWFPQVAHFEENGSVAVIGLCSHLEDAVLLWDENLSLKIEVPMTSSLFEFTRDGSFIHESGENESMLNEIDFRTGDFVKKHHFPLTNATSIHLAEESSRFDYYVVTRQHLYGFNKDTGEVELILDFLESHINLSTRYHIAFKTDRTFAISQERAELETQSWFVELAVLNPVSRSAIIERDYVLLAGFRLRPLFVDQVMDFNRRNPEQQIVVRDYWDINDSFGFSQAVDRMHFDILSGNTPDFILFEATEHPELMRARDALIRQGAFLDLYPLIDTDPMLSREDFFAHILLGLESAAGELPKIGNQLSVTTMVTTNPQIQVENWKVENFLTQIEQDVAMGRMEPLGSRITGTRFLTTMIDYIGDEFIDYESGISNFECDNFIRLLELAVAIPANLTYAYWPVDFSPDTRALIRGEQVVDMVGFAGLVGWVIGDFHDAAPEVFNFIGIPSSSGGVHHAQIFGTFSIFANSPNSNIAWQFIREELLQGATERIAISLRMDDFAERVASSNLGVTEQVVISDVVNQSTVRKPLSEVILMIIHEEFSALSRGTRTASETARVIQSRVQTYLWEQGR